MFPVTQFVTHLDARTPESWVWLPAGRRVGRADCGARPAVRLAGDQRLHGMLLALPTGWFPLLRAWTGVEPSEARNGPCRRPAARAGIASLVTARSAGRETQAKVSDRLGSVRAMTEPPADSLVYARGLTKRFDGFTAVDGIDVDVWRGEAFGFLGPNGAGKSSTMRMIGCVSPVTSGTLRVLGQDPATHGAEIRGRLGVVPQEDSLDLELTVRENLLVYGRYFGLSKPVIRRRADELLEFVQLTDKRDAKVDSLSGGMKRRLTIARSLVNEPEVLLLDEPTTGLDPQARHVLWDRLFRLKRQGVTLLLTTHYMDEAEQLCDRLVVMDKARIVAEGSPAELIASWSSREVVEVRFAPDEHEAMAGKLADLADRVEVLPDRLLLYTADGDAAAAAVHERGLRPVGVLVRRSTLEDVFLHLTGRTLVD